jgi:hypothetical protein
MESISNILGQKSFDEPAEVQNIKKYVMKKFKTDVGVQIRGEDFVILVPSAALAATLRLRGPEIKRVCGVNKRLIFRIAI